MIQLHFYLPFVSFHSKEVSSIQQGQKRKASESNIDGSDNEEALEDEKLVSFQWKAAFEFILILELFTTFLLLF